MRANRHKNRLIQADFDEHGAESFEFELLQSTSLSDMRAVEQRHIDGGEFTYNLAPKATGGGAHNENTIARMSAAHRDRKHTPETIVKLKARPAERNGGFIGYFHVPAGTYPSAYQAEEAMGGVLNFTTIRRWCRNPDKPFTIHSYKRSAYLKSFGPSVIGRTPRDLGFSFTPKVS